MASKDALTGKQTIALSALLECDTLGEVSSKTGVPPRTLHRWMNEDEAFQRAYRDAKKAIVAQVSRRLHSAMGDAVSTLEEIMGDGGAPQGARVQAAFRVLEFGHRAFEVENLQEQIEEMRKDLEELRRGAVDDLDDDGAPCSVN
jgi:DNA-binding transcriptional MerR regulator